MSTIEVVIQTFSYARGFIVLYMEHCLVKIVPIAKLLHLAANAEPPKTLQDAVVALKTVKSRQPVGGLFGLVVMFHHIFWRGVHV